MERRLVAACPQRIPLGRARGREPTAADTPGKRQKVGHVVSSGEVLLLTGSPGSGKTTVAPLVADRRSPSVCLDLDWFFAKLQRGAIEPWRAEAHAQNRVVLRAAAEAVAAFAQGGYYTVAEGILYPFMLDLFVQACAPHGLRLHYAVLRAPIGVVQQRVQDRLVEPPHAGALADAG